MYVYACTGHLSLSLMHHHIHSFIRFLPHLWSQHAKIFQDSPTERFPVPQPTEIHNASSESYVHTGIASQLGKPPEGFPQEASQTCLDNVSQWLVIRMCFSFCCNTEQPDEVKQFPAGCIHCVSHFQQIVTEIELEDEQQLHLKRLKRCLPAQSPLPRKSSKRLPLQTLLS